MSREEEGATFDCTCSQVLQGPQKLSSSFQGERPRPIALPVPLVPGESQQGCASDPQLWGMLVLKGALPWELQAPSREKELRGYEDSQCLNPRLEAQGAFRTGLPEL